MKHICSVPNAALNGCRVISIHPRYPSSKCNVSCKSVSYLNYIWRCSGHRRPMLCRVRVLEQYLSASTMEFLPQALDIPSQEANYVHELSSVVSPKTHDNQETSRCMGAMLGAMCGNVLGAPVQNDRHWMVMKRWPDGLTDFWRFDVGPDAVPHGHYTGAHSHNIAGSITDCWNNCLSKT
jgi:hypothetical protein